MGAKQTQPAQWLVVAGSRLAALRGGLVEDDIDPDRGAECNRNILVGPELLAGCHFLLFEAASDEGGFHKASLRTSAKAPAKSDWRKGLASLGRSAEMPPSSA